MTDRATVTAIRKHLRHTWRPFFGRFGNLTPVQVSAIPAVLSGSNVVIMSPTASGKTEAVVAPVAERHVQEDWEGLAVVYVVPTRALANDTLKRIKGPLEDLGLRAALKHSDQSYLPENLNWLITTPESLDSLICRRSHLFAGLRVVILDEIHLLDNTYRGDQLRVLLTRLRNLINRDFAAHILSATLQDAKTVAERYISSYQLITVPGNRPVHLHLVTSHEEVNQLARRHGWKKILYFCNTRENVETVAAQLTPIWKPYPVVAHHGSLSRQARQEAEHVLHESSRVVGVATSTLEVGIDIGDIDLVVLAEPPWSLSALMQRIGRGSRRSEQIQAAALIRLPGERIYIEAMFTAIAAGQLEAAPYLVDHSVGVQQILSIVFQHRGAGALDSFIKSMLTTLMHPYQIEKILLHLQYRGWIERRGDRWFATPRLIDEAERGDIHSNIPDPRNLQVFDVESNVYIGRIVGAFDQVFLLNGQAWQVIDITSTVVRVRRFHGEANAALFRSYVRDGRYSFLLPPSL